MASNYNNLSRAELIRLLRRRDAARKLGLAWERDELAHERALNDDFVAVDFDPGLSAGVAPFRNMLIEGENFDALRYLAAPLGEAVKCVYIDPPYNTGGRDFIYNDRYVDKTDSYRHSKWLEFMYRRLSLAKGLLAPDGAIFVSIGEDEFPRLSLLMEEIFDKMKVGVFVWRRRSGANDEKKWFVSIDHEYVLCFANDEFFFRGKEKDFSRYQNPDGDPRGEWIAGDLTKASNFKDRCNTFYPIRNPETEIWYPCNPERVWAFATEERAKDGAGLRRETIEELIGNQRVLWPKKEKVAVYRDETELRAALRKNEAHPNLRFYLSLNEIRTAVKRGEASAKLLECIPPLGFWIGKKIGFGVPKLKRFKAEVKREEKPISTWFMPSAIKPSEVELLDVSEVESLRCGYTQEGTKLLSAMLGHRDFAFPKPLSLVKALVKSATDPGAGDIVLDFFAGSATAGHAVMELNNEDGGDRRYILVSSTEATAKEPQKNICRDIAARRLQAAINGYEVVKREGGKIRVNGQGGGFAYFRAKRIAPPRIRAEIRHDQIWHALQQIHLPDFLPWQDGVKFATHESASLFLAYFAKATVAALGKVAQAAPPGKNVLLYSWQPGFVRDKFPGKAQVEKIPDSLMRRYGIEE